MLVRDHMCLQLATTTMPNGRRETAIREHVGMSAPIFWRHVDRLIDQGDVLAAYPVEVGRLRRVREARRRVRTGRS